MRPNMPNCQLFAETKVFQVKPRLENIKPVVLYQENKKVDQDIQG
jgi:hypothetical protein